MSELLEAQISNLANSPELSIMCDYDLPKIGTPVIGLRPLPEVSSLSKYEKKYV